MFIAFLFEGLVIRAPVCFHNDSSSTEEVHMKIHSSLPMLELCAAAAAASADHRALLG